MRLLLLYLLASTAATLSCSSSTTTGVASAFFLSGRRPSRWHAFRSDQRCSSSRVGRGGASSSYPTNDIPGHGGEASSSAGPGLPTTALQAEKQSDDTPNTSKPSSSSLLLKVGLVSLLVASTAAKFGILPGPYTNALIARDVGATLFTAAAGYGFVSFVSAAAAADGGVLDPRDSRKIIHTISAPAFMAFWPLFSPAPGARAFAVIVPLLNAVRLYLAGTATLATGGDNNKNDDDSGESELARAVSRSGNAEEALGGPFIYVCILAANILLFWRSSPVGVVSLATMAAGDGMADLIGRRYGQNNKWPGLDKSVAGTVAFWISSALASTALLLWLQHWGCLSLPPDCSSFPDVVVRMAGLSLVTAIVELIPIVDDNYTVPVSAAILAMIFFQ